VEKQSNNKREGKIITHPIQRNMLEIQVILVENLQVPTFGYPVAVCSKISDGAMRPRNINQ